MTYSMQDPRQDLPLVHVKTSREGQDTHMKTMMKSSSKPKDDDDGNDLFFLSDPKLQSFSSQTHVISKLSEI
ncbi:hypothetical protein I3842_08G128800 [Carya illinoinensis]|uniref:Uncharacterized protein n=1 Tax=Carya illinoinensis TaxID=32201 RepID=A0A922EDR4_CARIL|nr:hypothetical protein I3842_08G128800 [Carya illinoinensis]